MKEHSVFLYSVAGSHCLLNNCQVLTLLASFDRSCHVLACGDKALVIGEALLGFCAAGGLSWPASLDTALLVVGVLRAVHSAAERVLMAVVIV